MGRYSPVVSSCQIQNINTGTSSTFCLCSRDCKCSTKIWEVLKCFLQTVQEEMAVLLASWGQMMKIKYSSVKPPLSKKWIKHVSVVISAVSSWLLCAPLCDGGPWCCWWSGCGRWHTSSSSLLSSLCREHRLQDSQEFNHCLRFKSKHYMRVCVLTLTHLCLSPVASPAPGEAGWLGMRCSCVGSPSSSAGGKHCSYDSWSSAKTKTWRWEHFNLKVTGDTEFLRFSFTFNLPAGCGR